MSSDGSAPADSARSYCCGLTPKVLKCRAEQSQIHPEKAVLFEAPLQHLTERRSDSQFFSGGTVGGVVVPGEGDEMNRFVEKSEKALDTRWGDRLIASDCAWSRCD